MEKFSKREAYRNSLSLLELLLRKDKSNGVRETIPFHGFGALKELLLPLDNKAAWTSEDLRYEKEVFRFHQLLQEHFGSAYKPAITSLKSSILSSFYTPEFITTPIVEAVKQSSFRVDTILEPAAGTGNFISVLKKAFPNAAITAIEKDDTAFNALKHFHPDIETIHTGYENFKNRNFDLVISNIPFGNINVFDDGMFREAVPAKIKATTRIHNYYFVKSLDNLNEGGILALVAPSGVMDSPGNKDVREYLVKNADLLSATRLPNNVFEQAGTFPVTDIIFLKKNTRKKNISPTERSFTTNDKVQVLNEKSEAVQVDINAYYLEHRDHVLGTLTAGGQYDGRSLDVLPHEEATRESIEKSILSIADLRDVNTEERKISAKTESQHQQPVSNVLSKEHPDYHILKRGNLIIHQGKVGIIEFERTDKIVQPQPLIKDIDRTFLFTGLRNTMVRLVQSELDGDEPEMKKLRSELNARYDLFVFRFGNLNHPSNKKLFLLDAEGFKVLSMERLQGKQYLKADIFEKQINNVERTYQRPVSLNDAILLSLNARNGVDIQFMSSLLQWDKEKIIREGLESQLLFRDATDALSERYVTKDEFLSGNVVRKIELLEGIRNNNDRGPTDMAPADIALHLEKLNEVRPTLLKRDLIDINIGERWIPIDIYESFAEHLFKQQTEIKYLGSSDQFLVNVLGHSNEEHITYGATTHSGRITGGRIMEYAMADTQPYLQIRISDNPPQYKPDVDGMKNVEMKIREVKEAFEEFLNERQDVAERIEDLYNRNINNTVRRNYDGSHLQLSALNHFTPRSHQKDAIWMILQQDGGIIDHKVGAGKTLVMVAGAMEMRRLGISQKPLLLCMKANVADVAADFLKAYPSAKILAPDPQKDFTKQKRQGIFASIAANDWDAVIMTHDMFKAIPQSPQIKKDVLSRELENLEEDLNILAENRTLSKRVLKGLEARKENLKARIQEADASIKRDDNILDFDKMGFDHIFVDESQEYKNLHFTTRHQKVAGLGDPSGSQRALNLEFAIRTIQEKKGGDKGATFLSGTTISNSLVELYLLFKYLRPEKLEELRINSFDAWAKMYARKSATYEFSVTNELKMKERYREFIKVPELARFYAEITHVITDLNLKVDKPIVENIILNIDPTRHQQDYTQKLINFTKTKDPSHVDLVLNENEMSAFMLIATNLARKMSIDMRLINPVKYPFEQDGKIAKLCDTVAKEYNDSTHFKGTQLIFSDVGTPGGNGFNIYAEIKRILIEKYHLRPDEIQFIHDHDTKKKRELLFKKVNRGEVRVLIGSTKKLGTGVNVQERVIATHHLDIPWRPSDMEQRTGRGGRQGNRMAKAYRNNIVRNYIYAVNRTLDSYQFNILSNKQKFISQIKNNSIDHRKIDEGAFDQEGGMNFGEYVALLSGNTDLLEKVKLEKKLFDIERTFQVFLKRKSEAEFQIRFTRQIIGERENSLTRLEKDWKPIQNTDLEKVPLLINNTAVNDKKIAGDQLLSIVQNLNAEGVEKKDTSIARFLDFDLRYDPRLAKIYVSGSSSQVYNYADGKLNENPALAGRYVIDSVKRLPKIIANLHEDIQECHQKIKTYDKVLASEFKDKGLIKDIKHQINELNVRIEKATAKNDAEKEVKETIKTPELSMQNKRLKQRTRI